MSQPFTCRLAYHIGRQEFDAAIDHLRSNLNDDGSDAAALEMIAQCHFWAGRSAKAVAVAHEALDHDPDLFAVHALLANLYAENGEHSNAATHARRGLECYPEPLPEVPAFLIWTYRVLSSLLPRFRDADPRAVLKQQELEHSEWYRWANAYLDWYDSTYDESLKPSDH
ncbi:MAG: tetratricopeptide repeat protein [Filomicrobium sp.]